MLKIPPFGLALLALVLLTRPARSEEPSPTPEPAAEMNTDEKAFSQSLTGATLVGKFTIEGDDKPPKEDRYTLAKVTKLKNDRWLFMSRIQFGGKDVTVPLFLPVKWAGDTPMISVTDVTVPGLGTYTARVVFYRDHYAGTWSGGDHGGAMWGKIEHPKPKSDDPPKPDIASDTKK